MIRMGRSNKSEQPAETPQYKETYAGNTYSGGRQDVQPVTTSSSRGGAVSESEAIGRDIKEGRLSGFVGHGTVLTGETTFQSMLRIDGHLTGRVTSENGTLIVGSSGRVDANVMVLAATINGTVNGDIIALEKVELGRTARVMGNIQTPRFVIEDGAIFEGSCAMMKAQEALEQRAAQAKAQLTGGGGGNNTDNNDETSAGAETYETVDEEDDSETLSEAAAS
ncbi:MAG: bactofilin family protein [Pyrinomonadaceae bacterium]